MMLTTFSQLAALAKG